MDLEYQLSTDLAKPRAVLHGLWQDGFISLHSSDGTDFQANDSFFAEDAEQYCDTWEYVTLKCRLTAKGQGLYNKLPKREPATLNRSDNNRLTVFDKTFEFGTGETLCGGKDTGIRKDDSRTVLRALCEKPGHVVLFKSLLPETQDSDKEAQQPLKDAIYDLRKKLKPFGLSVENIRGKGYKMTTTSTK